MLGVAKDLHLKSSLNIFKRYQDGALLWHVPGGTGSGVADHPSLADIDGLHDPILLCEDRYPLPVQFQSDDFITRPDQVARELVNCNHPCSHGCRNLMTSTVLINHLANGD